MSDNFSYELNSHLFENKQIEVENNSFLKTIRTIEEQFPGNSTIYNSSDYNSSLNSISEIKKFIIENKIPYPDKDEIPEIKIQDLLSNENINNYLFGIFLASNNTNILSPIPIGIIVKYLIKIYNYFLINLFFNKIN